MPINLNITSIRGVFRLLVIICLSLRSVEILASSGGLSDRVSWINVRDEKVIKQQLDYSCGGASVATILRYYYGLDVDEKMALETMPDLDGDLSASLLELREGVKKFGFDGYGVETDFDNLSRLTIPAIVHLHYEGREHFSVVRGIDPATGLVWLGDPSWGNRHFSRQQFLALWQPEGRPTGHLLLIVPRDSAAPTLTDFFRRPRDRLGLARTLSERSALR